MTYTLSLVTRGPCNPVKITVPTQVSVGVVLPYRSLTECSKVVQVVTTEREERHN
jgi:hypothetical protein